MHDHYPTGTVRALLQSDLVTEATRQVLVDRLQQNEVVIPQFFNAQLFVTLKAVCARLIPQPATQERVDLAGTLDRFAAEGKGNGWRYDVLPPDEETYKKGVAAIDETSTLHFGLPFHLLATENQDEVLQQIQNGTAPGATWLIIPAPVFFEELLAALVEIYYSHPFGKEEIGDASMADKKGWQKIGLNELQIQEPKRLNKGVDDN